MHSVAVLLPLAKRTQETAGLALGDARNFVVKAFDAGLGEELTTRKKLLKALDGTLGVTGQCLVDTVDALMTLRPAHAGDESDDSLQAEAAHNATADWESPHRAWDQASAALSAWLAASNTNDATVIPLTNGRPGTGLTVGMLRTLAGPTPGPFA